MDCHEVGRAFSTLMSNKFFHDICYSFEAKEDLLIAINDFLDESIVLPPGDWARYVIKYFININYGEYPDSKC